MSEVHIWRTLAGVVVLSPDAFGFSYCVTPTEIDKLRADLEAGVSMGKAVGFSGSACSFQKLVRVESKQGSPTIVVVARDFLGKAKEDFTFQRQADREAFYETLLQLLGPDWRCEEASRGSCILLLLPIFAVLFGLFNLLCGGLLLSTPPKPNANPNPAGPPMPQEIMWGLMGFGLLVAVLGVAGFFWIRKVGRTTWETIRSR